VKRARSSPVRCASLAGVGFIAACGGSGHEFQPLAEGHIWRYAVETHVGDATRRSMLEERSVGPLQAMGASVHGLRRQDGMLNLVQVQEGGVQRVAVADAAGEITPLAVPEWVLPPEQAGEWTVASHTGLIERRVDDFEEAGFRIPVPIELRYRALEGTRSVVVPLGRFEGCRELVGRGEREVVRNRQGQLTRISVEQHDFYCPGVGLTLRERRESTDNAIIYNGSYRQALTELRRP